MTDLTPREILDAIRRGLETTARRFTPGKVADGHDQDPNPRQPIDRCEDQDTPNRLDR